MVPIFLNLVSCAEFDNLAQKLVVPEYFRLLWATAFRKGVTYVTDFYVMIFNIICYKTFLVLYSL